MPAGVGYGPQSSMTMAQKATAYDDAMKAAAPGDDAEKGMPPAFLAKLKEKKDAESGGKDSAGEEQKKAFHDKAKKSSLTEHDLQKSLAGIENFIGSTQAGRREALLQKSLDGTASEDEQAELVTIMSGSTGVVAEEIVKSFGHGEGEEENLAKSTVDASPFLTHIQDGVVGACAAIGDVIEKSQSQQGEFNLVLAKGLLDIGRTVEALVKSLPNAQAVEQIQKSIGANAAALEKFGHAPIHPPRSTGTGSGQLEKSMAGAPPAGQAMPKGEVLNLMEEMLHKSVDAGREGFALCGEDLNKSSTKYETLGRISPGMQQEVLAFRASKINGAQR